MKSRLAVIALTPNGRDSALKLCHLMEAEVHLPMKLQDGYFHERVFYYKESFRERVGKLMREYESIIFLMATGIVVRVAASFLKDKSQDPAIVVMDEKMKFAVSLLSGHLGGANRLTSEVAEKTGAVPVITTSTDVNEKTAWDMVSKEWRAYSYLENEKYKELNFAEVSGKKILVCIDLRFEEDLEEILSRNGVREKRIFRSVGSAIAQAGEGDVIVFFTDRYAITHQDAETAVLKDGFILRGRFFFPVIKRQYAVGIGCRKGISYSDLKEQFDLFLKKENIHPSSIGLLTSIEIKKEEGAILRLSKELDVPFLTYTKEEIQNVESSMEDMEKSEFVFQNVGVYNVSQSCAYLAGNGNIVVKKKKYRQATFAVSKLPDDFFKR